MALRSWIWYLLANIAAIALYLFTADRIEQITSSFIVGLFVIYGTPFLYSVLSFTALGLIPKETKWRWVASIFGVLYLLCGITFLGATFISIIMG